MTVADVMPRVEKGAAWLDANKPGWFRAIDVPELSIQSCTRCILGQLFGGYISGLSAMGLGSVEAFANGWSLSNGEACAVNYESLREAWITAILERQFASQPVVVPIPVGERVSE